MRYVLLIYGSESDYARLTDAERSALMQRHGEFAQQTLQSGQLTGGGPLQATGTATTLRIRSGKTLMTDGPFAETKEQLGGFYIVDCKDLDEALGMAARLPDAAIGSVEVRPMIEL